MKRSGRKLLSKNVSVALVATLTLALLAACGNVGEGAGGGEQGGDGGNGGGTGGGNAITVGSKNFTEQYILGELYAAALEDNGYSVQKRLNLGSEQIADQALQDGEIDFYPEYTGTSLEAILDFEGEQPDTPEATYEEARQLYSERDTPMTMLEPADFNNTYGIFVNSQVAEEQGIETLPDLAEASGDLRFVSFSEFQNRGDGYPNMQDNYPAFDFQDTIIVNSIGGPIYQGVNQGEGDVGVGFRTDGQLASDDFTVMEDPQEIWPFYYPAPVVRSDVLDENPDMQDILNEVSATLDLETMQQLNAQVGIEQEDQEEVAREFLEEQGVLN